MCRWIAYRGVKTIALEHYVTSPAHSLIEQSIRALESTAATNGDGFGLGWYGHHAEPGLYREVRPAWSDENLRYLCRHIQSHLFLCACARGHRHTDYASELPSLCLRSLHVHAQWLDRKLVAAAPTGGGARSRRILSVTHRHDRLRGSLSRNPGLWWRQGSDCRDRARFWPRFSDMVCANGLEEPLRFTAALRRRPAISMLSAIPSTTPQIRSIIAPPAKSVVIVSEPLDGDPLGLDPGAARSYGGCQGRSAGGLRAASARISEWRPK